jgi:hypothetical protein
MPKPFHGYLKCDPSATIHGRVEFAVFSWFMDQIDNSWSRNFCWKILWYMRTALWHTWPNLRRGPSSYPNTDWICTWKFSKFLLPLYTRPTSQALLALLHLMFETYTMLPHTRHTHLMFLCVGSFANEDDGTHDSDVIVRKPNSQYDGRWRPWCSMVAQRKKTRAEWARHLDG